MCILSLYMYLGFCFHNFVLFTVLFSVFSVWETVLENLFLLAAIFHMEHNINFPFSIVATYARMEIPCTLYFSSHLWIAVTAPCWRQSCACVLTQLCPTLCNPRDCSPPGFSVHGIILARILEWVAISSSRWFSQLRDQTCISCDSCVEMDSLPLSHWRKSQNSA